MRELQPRESRVADLIHSFSGTAQGMKAEAGGPYKDLYVYLVRGSIGAKEEMLLGKDFLGNWVEGEDAFLFFSRPSEEWVEKLLEKRADLELLEKHRFSYEQWQGGRSDLLRVGPFVIAAPWAEAEAGEDEYLIRLDPGVVFGNALHPTTRDCLRALAYAQKQRPFKKVLDLGTGSGILALAAARLGAEKVLAVDLNPLCIKTAAKNIEFNKLAEVIELKEGSAIDCGSITADLLMTNIHFEVIRDLIDRQPLQYGERLILSGLMRSQAEQVRRELPQIGFAIEKEWEHGLIWFTLLAEKVGAKPKNRRFA